MSESKEFTAAQILLVFRGALSAKGADVPIGMRIAEECKSKEWIFHDPSTGGFTLLPQQTPAKAALNLKDTDYKLVWNWIKTDIMQDPTAAKLYMLGSFAGLLCQESDFANTMEKFKETDEEGAENTG